jgi:hypothetical protein
MLKNGHLLFLDLIIHPSFLISIFVLKKVQKNGGKRKGNWLKKHTTFRKVLILIFIPESYNSDFVPVVPESFISDFVSGCSGKFFNSDFPVVPESFNSDFVSGCSGKF